MVTSIFTPIKGFTAGEIHRVFRLLLVMVLLPLNATAQTHETQRVIVQNPLVAASQLIENGYIEQAQAILDAVDQLNEAEKAKLDSTEISFLLGRIAYARQNYNKAADIFSAILYDQPNLARVRLELARVYFSSQKHRQAEEHFKYSLSDNLPDATNDNIISFLRRIDDAKLWRYRFDFSIAPNSNINTATDAETVNIFGLPFSLSDDANSKSGVGVKASASVEFRPTIKEGVRLQSNLNIQRTEYDGGNFDDTIVSGFIGPSIKLNNSTLNIGASGFRHWFGNDGFNRAVGATINYRTRFNSRLETSINLTAQNIKYDRSPEKDGTLISINTQTNYALDGAKSIGLIVGYNKNSAKVKYEENITYQLGASFSQKLQNALSLYVSGYVNISNYDDIHPSFAIKRSDKLYSVNVELSKRDVFIFGMIPVIRYGYTNNNSNIALYNYSRHQAGFGLVKLF